MIIQVKVIANSKTESVEKLDEFDYKVHLKEKPEQGKANLALINLLARHFECSENQIKIVKGKKSNKKIVDVANEFIV